MFWSKKGRTPEGGEPAPASGPNAGNASAADAVPDALHAAVLGALRTVQDPDLHRDLVTLGMIKDLKVDPTAVSLQVELTTPACPLKETIERDVRAAITRVLPHARVDVSFGAQVRGSRANQGGQDLVPHVKNVILVASGKGGVGKSTVAANLACALAAAGARVGLMDADIYGPSIPTMFGLSEQPGSRDGKRIEPLKAHGISVMSIGFFVPPEKAVVWRGPMVTGAIVQFLRDVDWGELDYLVCDLPPGTGDAQLTFAQQLQVTGAVIVSTPQDVALMDVVRARAMFETVNIPILGMVENMSFFLCDGCGKRHEIFAHGGARVAAERMGVPFLGEVPIELGVRETGDAGCPVTVARPESAAAGALRDIAGKVAARIAVLHQQAQDRAQDALRSAARGASAFSAGSRVGDVLRHHPGARGVLQTSGIDVDEVELSLEAAAARAGTSAEALLHSLSSLAPAASRSRSLPVIAG